MIEVARKKAEQIEGVEFTVQDIRDFEFEDSLSLITCTFNTLNYLVNSPCVVSVFSAVHRALSAPGVFVFDVNTARLYEAHHRGVITRDLGCRTVIQELTYDSSNRLATTVFRFPDGTMEIHRQRAYDGNETIAFLAEAGLTCVSSYCNLGGDPFQDDSERLICVAETR
jgi:SAM-dependent methyltransferase